MDFSGFDMTQNEACKLHRDWWQFILQGTRMQVHYYNMPGDHYSHVLYQPILNFLRVE